METITSRENAKIKYACAVRDSEKQRAADGLFFAEGPKLCLELAKSCTPRAMYATAAALAKTPELAQFDPAEIAPHVAEKLSGTKSNQGVFALFETPVPPADTLDTASAHSASTTHALRCVGLRPFFSSLRSLLIGNGNLLNYRKRAYPWPQPT